jgi:hypothetical protein
LDKVPSFWICATELNLIVRSGDTVMTRQLSALVLYFVAAPFAWGQLLNPAAPSTLVPYTICAFSDRLAAVSVDRLNDTPMIRMVNTASGSKPVSVADGYRVMFAYPNTDYFVNLKVEQSVAGRFAEDRQHIVEQMQEIVAHSSGRIMKLEQNTTKGIAVFGLNNRGIDTGGVVSSYTLFDDAKGIVVTAYILNGDPRHRAFDSVAQYLELRDRFVSAFVSCMAKNRP